MERLIEKSCVLYDGQAAEESWLRAEMLQACFPWLFPTKGTTKTRSGGKVWETCILSKSFWHDPA